MARKIGSKSQSGCNSDELEALDKVVREEFPAMIREAQRWVGNREDAQDRVQEVFLKIIANREKYEPDNLKSYIHRMIKNTCLNFVKKRKRDESLRFADPQMDLLPDPSHPTPEGEIECQEIKDCLSGILTPLQNKVFILHHLEGYTYQEIALELGKTVKSVERALCRAREKIGKFYIRGGGF